MGDILARKRREAGGGAFAARAASRVNQKVVSSTIYFAGGLR
jgi:hypothetical protein